MNSSHQEYKTRTEDLFELHASTTANCLAIMKAKNKDYAGGSGDPYANFRMASAIGLHPVSGILLRMMDKVQRIRSFLKHGELAVKTESWSDACDDIINYAILMKGLLKEEATKQQAKDN